MRKYKKKMHLAHLKAINFNEKTTKAWQWVSKVFGSKTPTHNESRSLAELFSFLIKEGFKREHYRRKVCCLHWIETNINKIADFLSKHIVTVKIKGRMINVFSPALLVRNTTKNCSTETKEEDNKSIFSLENIFNDEFEPIEYNFFDEFIV